MSLMKDQNSVFIKENAHLNEKISQLQDLIKGMKNDSQHLEEE